MMINRGESRFWGALIKKKNTKLYYFLKFYKIMKNYLALSKDHF